METWANGSAKAVIEKLRNNYGFVMPKDMNLIIRHQVGEIIYSYVPNNVALNDAEIELLLASIADVKSDAIVPLQDKLYSAHTDPNPHVEALENMGYTVMLEWNNE